MENTVFLFLGAGASHCFGYKTFYNFSELLLNDNLMSDYKIRYYNYDNIKNLFLLIIKTLETNNIPATHDNILWKLCDYRNMSFQLRKDKIVKDRFLYSTLSWASYKDFSETVEDCIKIITHITINHYSENKLYGNAKNVDTALNIIDFLKYLYERNGDFVDMYTTNYDTLYENIKSEIDLGGISFVDGISDKDKKWSSKEYEICNAIKYYRLHGCVDWYYDKNGNINQIIHDSSKKESINKVYKNSCIMFPSKDQFKGNQPHSLGYIAFHRSLTSSSIAVFIGFSFRDNDVNQIILNAISNNDGIKLIFVNPHLTKEEFLLRLGDAKRNCQFNTIIPEKINYEFFKSQSSWGEKNFFDDLKKIIGGMYVKAK